MSLDPKEMTKKIHDICEDEFGFLIKDENEKKIEMKTRVLVCPSTIFWICHFLKKVHLTYLWKLTLLLLLDIDTNQLFIDDM